MNERTPTRPKSTGCFLAFRGRARREREPGRALAERCLRGGSWRSDANVKPNIVASIARALSRRALLSLWRLDPNAKPTFVLHYCCYNARRPIVGHHSCEPPISLSFSL
ncbi:hypothetical protein Acr_24g0008970 [Actinidia rufa]|uniref:Uncharacterized protein n=1 Tax=Actinidia rufa TaxID=165716 RepID=A0A7J0GV30_9ERIC|nr:hypothetical protein Acr_24g0008970 [Actinidia rufa]